MAIRKFLGYTGYDFGGGEQDPIVDKMRTMIEDSGLSYKKLSELSGVSSGTYTRWFSRNVKKRVKRPMFSTVMATVRGAGCDLVIAKQERRVNGTRDVKLIRNVAAKAHAGLQ
jgi:transcriptional regulator with XRE-family HTH domain